MAKNTYTIGLDYGSNSVRCLVMDVRTGATYGVATRDYPSGDAGVFTDPDNPHVARQSPLDFVQTLEEVVPEALRQAGEHPDFSPEQVIAIGVDTTGSTPIPVTDDLTPLAALPRFVNNLNAMAWMWKDHSAMNEAERITELARKHRPHYLAKCGGTYSSEWFFSKILHCLEVDREVFDAAHTWIEWTDYIPAVLAAIRDPEKVQRSVCAAGHKAMYCDEWGGYPDAEFLAKLDPAMGALRERLSSKAWPADHAAGRLCPEYARKLGLPEGIAIAVGAFDAHLGGVGAGIAEGRMV